jgi:prophage regulatory protein
MTGVHFLRLPDLQRVTGLKRSRLDELERRGEFPARVRISNRAVAWRSDEVERWIESRQRAG